MIEKIRADTEPSASNGKDVSEVTRTAGAPIERIRSAAPDLARTAGDLTESPAGLEV